MNWTLAYRLNSSVYAPLQTGTLTDIRITNNTDKKMVVTTVLLKFDWMGGYRFYRDCNIKVGPKKIVSLPLLTFSIELSASKGSHNFLAGIEYNLLEDEKWKKYSEFETSGDFIEIQPLPQKNYSVFVSHSNAPADAKMIRECKAAMKSCGISGYFAEDDIKPAGLLWNKIAEKIKTCDAILLLWTKSAANSGDVREEIGMAVAYKKQNKIIPIVQKKIELKGSLKSLGTEYIDYEPPEHTHSIHDALVTIMQWAKYKEEKIAHGTKLK